MVVIVGVYALLRFGTGGSRVSHPPTATPSPFFARLATQDWLVAGYLATLFLLVLSGQGERQPKALLWLTLDLLGFAALLGVARAPGVAPWIANVAYRAALPGAIIVTFSQLHYILPSARTVSFDAEIYALDKTLFHYEPAEAWDRFVTPSTTEWFSFFYYLYFAILLVHVVPIAIFERRVAVLREFAWGIFTVFCVGQIVYMLVPGFGPYRLLASRFQHPLEGPHFWPLVAKTVASFDGAHRTDIFPSLHTATPTFFSLFAYRNRDKLPFRYTWPVMVFVTINIILATMFLRWHYLLDVFAGLGLATLAAFTAARYPAREDVARARAGLPPIWRPLFAPDAPSVVSEAEQIPAQLEADGQHLDVEVLR